MTRWSRINLLLAVLAIALLIADQWPARDDSPAGRSLTDLNLDDISSVRIERGHRLTLALQRDAGGWQLIHPLPVPAAGHRVAQLLAVARAEAAQCFPVAGNAGRYGLDDPQAILQIGLQIDRLRLAFGQRDPSQQARYVLLGDEVCVIDDLYFNLLTLPPSHYAAGDSGQSN